jgi:Bacterial regulatory proteins, gntR family
LSGSAVIRGEGLSVRALARKYGVHRRLVREALMRAVAVLRRTKPRPRWTGPTAPYCLR